MNNKKRLMLKLAYSKNDHMIPNDICIKEIQYKKNNARRKFY